MHGIGQINRMNRKERVEAEAKEEALANMQIKFWVTILSTMALAVFAMIMV